MNMRVSTLAHTASAPVTANAAGSLGGRFVDFFKTTLPAFFAKVAEAAKNFFSRAGEFFKANARWIWPVFAAVVAVAAVVAGVVIAIKCARKEGSLEEQAVAAETAAKEATAAAKKAAEEAQTARAAVTSTVEGSAERTAAEAKATAAEKASEEAAAVAKKATEEAQTARTAADEAKRQEEAAAQTAPSQPLPTSGDGSQQPSDA